MKAAGYWLQSSSQDWAGEGVQGRQWWVYGGEGWGGGDVLFVHWE